MGLRSKNIDYIRKRRIYGPNELNGLITAADGGSTTFGEGVILQSPLDATVFQSEVGAFGIVGILIPTTKVLQTLINIPYDVDPYFKIGFRIKYSATTTTATTCNILWTLEQKVTKPNAALTAVASLAALDTPIVIADGNVTAFTALTEGIRWSSRGILNSLGLSRQEVFDGASMQLEIKVAFTTISLVKLLCLEMDYVSNEMLGTNELDRPLTEVGY